MVFLGSFLGGESRKRVKNQRYKRLNTPKMWPKKLQTWEYIVIKKIYNVRYKFAEISLKTFVFFPHDRLVCVIWGLGFENDVSVCIGVWVGEKNFQ